MIHGRMMKKIFLMILPSMMLSFNPPKILLHLSP